MSLWLLAIGAVSLLGQVVLLRELNVALYGSELVYILAIGVWLLGTAFGVSLGRRSHLPTVNRVRVLLIGLGLVLPICVMLVRGTRQIWGGVPGAYLAFPTQMAAMAVALLPVSVALGLLFQWTAKLFVTSRRTLAKAYAVESAGGLAGGILATVFLAAGVQNLATALGCGLLAVVVARGPRENGRPVWLGPALLLAASVLTAALLMSPRLDLRSTAWNHPNLLDSRDSPYGRVTLSESLGQIAVFENGALAYETEGTAAEEFVHLAALQHAAPESILVLGGGGEGLVREVLQHRPTAVDYVELNRVLLDLWRRYLPADVRRSLDAPEVHIRQADPRRFLQSAPVYDLILVAMPDPASGQSNRYYTREFFALCATRLKPTGVLAFRLRSAENLWTPQLLRRIASIHHALRAVFADVVVLPGATNILLASPAKLTREPALLAERLRARGIVARLVSPAYIDYLYTNDRFGATADLLQGASVTPNSDIRPVCYQFTLILWLAKFFPVLAWLELPETGGGWLVRSVWFWAGLAGLLGAMLLCRHWRLARRGVLAATAGFAGMVLQAAFILNYQTGSGVLYQNLGLLLTVFMAGLALGAGALDRLARRELGRGTGYSLLALFVLFAAMAAGLLAAGLACGLVATALLQLASGFFVAAVFAYASLYRQPDQRAVISPLYAADLLGGCLGTLAASLFLIPVLGLAGSALAMAIVLALTCAVI